jgi:hypothetical protein
MFWFRLFTSYGPSSGSEFLQDKVPVPTFDKLSPVPVPTFDKLRIQFRFRLLTSYGSESCPLSRQ